MARFTVLVLIAFGFAAGAAANTLTGTKFPFENCRQATTTALYSSYLDSYQLTPTGSKMCFKILVQTQAACRRASKYPRNTTRCCDVGFNKFKFYPNQACRQAVKGATIKLAGSTRTDNLAVTYQTMGAAFGNQFVMKLTNLRLTPITAKNALICIELQAPCPTMTVWSKDPDMLEFNMYDAKLNYAYECCPAGTADVARFPFSQSQTGRSLQA